MSSISKFGIRGVFIWEFVLILFSWKEFPEFLRRILDSTHRKKIQFRILTLEKLAVCSCNILEACSKSPYDHAAEALEPDRSTKKQNEDRPRKPPANLERLGTLRASAKLRDSFWC